MTGDEDRAGGLAVARALAAAAVWADGVCAFHGAAAPAELGLPVVFRSFGGDLYEGSAGIARFLALAARLSGDSELVRVARGAAAHALARAEGWSLYSGQLGSGLAVLEVAEWLEGPELVLPAVQQIERASEAAARAAAAGEAPADLLGGLAGAVLGLVAARPYDLDGGWLRRAEALGAALVAAGRPVGAGLAWPLQPGAAICLCGLGHGASGVALALEALEEAAGGGWRATARRARDFERGWYAPERGSWADLRADPPSLPHMWCHGSVGVAAERLRTDAADLLARGDLVGALAGVRAAAEDLIAGPRGPGAGDALNGSQCHGLGGMSDLFVDAWRRDRGGGWLELARACTATMRDDARRPEGLRCGIPGGEATPGLMLGLAGIGWAQLRAAHPETVPSAWYPGGGLMKQSP